MSTEYAKPLPEVTEDNRPFWEGCKRHELLLQKCTDCGHMRYVSPICPKCWSLACNWVPASGKGTVYSWIIVHQRYHRAFAEELPYNVTVVELEEGPRLVTNLVEIDNDDIHAALPVTVVWDDVTDDITLPKFKPVRG